MLLRPRTPACCSSVRLCHHRAQHHRRAAICHCFAVKQSSPSMMRGLLSLALVGAAAAQALDEKVTESGGLCDPGVKQFSGYHHLTTGDKHYFYWGFESRNDPKNDPVVLWMTGGPGCSSAVALFAENGPCHLDAEGKNTTINPYSWNSNATLIYVDQPTGTGFSYGLGFDMSEAGVARDMYDFLQQFFKGHPEYQNHEFYIFGESYGGHYVPSVGAKVHKENQALKDGNVHINLKGISIGNGLTNPEIQYKYYPDMAFSNNSHKPAIGKLEYEVQKAAVPLCLAQIKACNAVPLPWDPLCLSALEYCNLALAIPYTLTGRNTYDMREPCKKPPLCYDFSNIGKFLHRHDVQEQLGVKAGFPWQSCDRLVTLFMTNDWMHGFQNVIPGLLAGGVKVELYVGDQDFICNWLGNKAWALDLEWPGKAAFNAAADEGWALAGTEKGKRRAHGGFSFVQVYEAGHMVPMNQPEFALEILNAFIH